jgi:hypothetical protein
LEKPNIQALPTLSKRLEASRKLHQVIAILFSLLRLAFTKHLDLQLGRVIMLKNKRLVVSVLPTLSKKRLKAGRKLHQVLAILLSLLRPTFTKHLDLLGCVFMLKNKGLVVPVLVNTR